MVRRRSMASARLVLQNSSIACAVGVRRQDAIAEGPIRTVARWRGTVRAGVLLARRGAGAGAAALFCMFALASARRRVCPLRTLPMKRVQLQLPDPVVDWIDAQADGIESRASFIRRSIVGLMKAEQRRQLLQPPASSEGAGSHG